MAEQVKTLDESILDVMDCQEMAIITFLHYIFQDLWELGTPPEKVINLVKKHCKNIANLHVLDLGSGKGAISVKLAAALKCHCYGIDGIVEFVEASKEKAREYGVETLCHFEVGDVRKKIEELGTFDVIILGATGPIFEDYCTALTSFSRHLTAEGIVMIEEAYSTTPHPFYLSREELLKQFKLAGMDLIDETADKYSEFVDSAQEIKSLTIRCNELKTKYPDKASLFENYATRQASQANALENETICSVMVLKKAQTKCAFI